MRRTSKGVRIAAVSAALLATVTATAFTGTALAQPQAANSAPGPEVGLHLGSRPSEREIAALFEKWNTALATGKPTVVADLYASNAVLLPTVSNEVRTTRAGIVRYFETFLTKRPSGRILSSTITVLDRNTATSNGTYRFSFSDGSTVDARFSYVYEKVGGRWLIVTHHSSAMPEK